MEGGSAAPVFEKPFIETYVHTRMLMGTAMPMCTSIFRAIPLRCHGLRTSVFVRTPRESLFLHMYIYIQVYMHALFLYVMLLFIHIP